MIHQCSILKGHASLHIRIEDKLTEVRPLGKSSRAQLAMTVLSLHRLGLTDIAWHLFDQLSKDGASVGIKWIWKNVSCCFNQFQAGRMWVTKKQVKGRFGAKKLRFAQVCKLEVKLTAIGSSLQVTLAIYNVRWMSLSKWQGLHIPVAYKPHVGMPWWWDVWPLVMHHEPRWPCR